MHQCDQQIITFQASVAEASMSMEDDNIKDASDENMYAFEGKDYKQEPTAADRKAFQDLLDGIEASFFTLKDIFDSHIEMFC